MSTAQALRAPARLFPFERWSPKVSVLARHYRENHPCPHILLEDFLEPEVALEMSKEFPEPASNAWTQYKHANENKLGMPKRELFPASLGAVTDELNSPEFVAWVSELTGIPNLMADPMLEGGGLHQSGPGGYLNVHTDFSKHHFHTNWHRRVNLILYLNPGWDEKWGGSIELWERSPEKKMTRCGAKYAPLLNHALIFTTDERSLHGFPDPLTCPEGQSRKSLALYYYTLEPDEKFAAHSTDYFARPQDGWGKATMIWLDKKAVDLYSRAKARFGFSDEFASKVLGWLSGKK
ncbi:MAG TPA: 2OG-Fe(II) oxygenase [Candidatus Sulfotelmatobacter sp.]|jgi:Rps23 Pro-64 3,4-dihydroxylase Tpa1-like proline 4-hydroxylase|nr:2OG-Fe(II) oxygenase [Candidatus Sulfotelmatobacter sp.]